MTQRDWSKLDMRWMWVGVALTGLDLVGALVWDQGPNEAVALLGGALWISGLALLAAPILILRRKGGVSAGKRFVDTTKLVTTGLYSVVRHPQYLGWLVLASAVPFYTQEPASAALAVASVAATWRGFRGIDAWELSVFGAEYAEYMRRVPGFDLPLGVWRALARREKG